MARRAWNQVGNYHMCVCTVVTVPDNNNSECIELRFASFHIATVDRLNPSSVSLLHAAGPPAQL